METSSQFSYVPYIGESNLLRVTDNDTGDTHRFIMNLDAASDALWTPKNTTGDGGNGDDVDSFTDQDPAGRAGKMITHLEVLGQGENADNEMPAFIALVAIPAGLEGLLLAPPSYSLSKQPPAQSFDYSKWIPRVDARGVLSFYGANPGESDSSPFVPVTGRFPTAPILPPFENEDVIAGPLLYIPTGFYNNINDIVSDALNLNTDINVSLVDTPQYGALLVCMSWAAAEQVVGSGAITVDFSHSAQN